MATKKPTPATAMTERQRITAQKKSQSQIKSIKSKSLKTKVENKVKEVKSAYDKVSKTPGIIVKGGPRPKMQRMAQPAKPKTGTTKSRGSNTATQVGNENQREFYNGQRIPAGSRTGYYMGYNSKQDSKSKPKFTLKGMEDTTRTGQRAGGRQNLSEVESKAKANAKRISNKPKAPLKSVKPKAPRGR